MFVFVRALEMISADLRVGQHSIPKTFIFNGGNGAIGKCYFDVGGPVGFRFRVVSGGSGWFRAVPGGFGWFRAVPGFVSWPTLDTQKIHA